MSLNTNAYYEIGSYHQVCEDYALSGTYQDMAYAIVSDGCSSSENSDVGARLIAHIAKGVIIYLKDKNAIGVPGFHDVFKELIIKKGIEVKNSLGLSSEAFDATLLVNIVFDNKIYSIAWGDGYIIYKTKESKHIIYDISFSSRAPYYLSYEMSPTKKQQYMMEFGEGTITIKNSILSADGNFERTTINKIIAESLYKEAYAPSMSFATVSSDGLGTYEDDPKVYREDGTEKKSYKAIELIPQVMAYKTIAGEFVIRRMHRMKTDMAKANIIHFDDISCASIAL